MKPFTVDTGTSRVVFGPGSVEQLAVEVDRIEARRVLLVSTPGRSTLADKARQLLGPRVVGLFDKAVVHVPETVASEARNLARRLDADCVVALGGGSAIGAAKAIALDVPVSIVAVPTTYGGSEMTPIWGETKDGIKTTGRDPRVQPQVVIYDPDLTLGLPGHATACSGLNAMAHCIEALYAPDANHNTASMALEGLTLLHDALARVVAAPTDREQRSRALRGAWLAGSALGSVQMGLHHKLCHTVGGTFDLPHADTHAVLLPYTMTYNRDAARKAMSSIAEALGVEDAPVEVLSLARTIEAPLSLKQIGLSAANLDRAADLAVEREYPNPRPVTRDGVRELLQAAFDGNSEYVLL